MPLASGVQPITEYAPTNTFKGMQQRGVARPTSPDDEDAQAAQRRAQGGWNFNQPGGPSQPSTPSQPAAPSGGQAAPPPPTEQVYRQPSQTGQAAPPPPAQPQGNWLSGPLGVAGGNPAAPPPAPHPDTMPPPGTGPSQGVHAAPWNAAPQAGQLAGGDVNGAGIPDAWRAQYERDRSAQEGRSPVANTPLGSPFQGGVQGGPNPMAMNQAGLAPQVAQMAAQAPAPSIDIHGGMPSPSAPAPGGVTAAPWNQSPAASMGAPTPGSVAPSAATYWGANSPASASAPTATSGPGGFDLGNYLQSMLGISTMPQTPQTQAYGSGYTGGLNLPGLLAQRLASGQASASAQTQGAIGQQLANPTGFTSDAVQQTYNNLGGQIDDQFALQQKQLKDEMAARGLNDSSINAGRMSDLNIGQRSAKTQLASNLATEQARALQSGRANAIGQSLGADEFGNSATSGLIGQLLGAGQQGFSNSAQLDQLRAALRGQTNNQALGWAGQLQGYGNDAFQHDVTTNQVNQNALDSQSNLYLKLLGLA